MSESQENSGRKGMVSGMASFVATGTSEGGLAVLAFFAGLVMRDVFVQVGDRLFTRSKRIVSDRNGYKG